MKWISRELWFGALELTLFPPMQVNPRSVHPCSARKSEVLDRQQIVKQIKEGKKGEDDKPKMPPFEGKLTDAELKLLVTVVKEFRP